MNLRAQKVELIKMLVATSDAALIKDVKKLFEHSKERIEDISSTKLASIKRGLDDIEKGNVHSHADVRKMYEKWL
jgi:predicted transcriptional regulator